MQSIVILQVKSFGDFVIALTSVAGISEAQREHISFAIGAHLQDLLNAISPDTSAIILDTREQGVPSLFDVKKRGVGRAILSAFSLRDAITKADIPSETIIVQDRLGLRERIMAGNRSTATLDPGATGIYAGYRALFKRLGFELSNVQPDHEIIPASGVVGIFPGSRVAYKNLPRALIEGAMEMISESGREPRLFLLEGERVDLEQSDMPAQIVPRSFAEMRNAVARCRAVVSADSLPAHLAELAGVANFVFTPRTNDFWMTPSILRYGRRSLFADPQGLHALRVMLDHG